jgi:hypothetical protein
MIAFEAKLEKWRVALHQAYRNRCFAHRSYVVLPARAARAALRSSAEFTRRGVGLVVVTPDGLRCLVDAPLGTPWQMWLCETAINFVFQGRMHGGCPARQ